MVEAMINLVLADHLLRALTNKDLEKLSSNLRHGPK